MEHLKPLRPGKVTIVHAQKDREYTWCGWKYITDNVLNGSRIPRAGSTPEPLTCKKCAGAMHMAMQDAFRRLMPPQSEEVYELTVKLAGERAGRKRS